MISLKSNTTGMIGLKHSLGDDGYCFSTPCWAVARRCNLFVPVARHAPLFKSVKETCDILYDHVIKKAGREKRSGMTSEMMKTTDRRSPFLLSSPNVILPSSIPIPLASLRHRQRYYVCPIFPGEEPLDWRLNSNNQSNCSPEILSGLRNDQSGV